MPKRTVPDYTISMLGLLRYAFRLYRQNFTTLVGIAAVIEIPLVVLNLLTAGQFIDLTGASALPPQGLLNILVAATGLSLIPALVAGVATGLRVLGAAAIAIAATQRYQRQLSVAQAYGYALDYPGSLLMVGLVFALLGFLYSFAAGISTGLVGFAQLGSDNAMSAQAPFISGAIFLVASLAYFFLSIRWVLTPQALVLGKHEGWSSLGSSWQLTGRSFLWTGAIWLSFEVVAYLVIWISVQFITPLLVNVIAPVLVLSQTVVLPFVDAVLLCQVFPLYAIIYTLLFLKLQPRLSQSRFPVVLEELAASSAAPVSRA